MKKKNVELAFLFMSLFFLILTACSNPLTSLPEDETGTTQLNTAYVDGVLDQLKADLTMSSAASSSMARVSSSWDNNLTASEIDAIIAAARSKVENQGLLESTNLAAFLPLVIEGAQSQIGQTTSASATSVKMNVIETMISSSVRIIDDEVGSEAGKTSLIVSVTETVVKNIPNVVTDADEIGDVAGGALSILTSTTESIFTIDSISNVVSTIASTSIEALSVAYNSVGTATADDVSTGVSVVTGSILSEIQTFSSLEGNTLGETLVEVTSSVNSSIGILAGNIDSNNVTGDVSITSMAGGVISTVTDKILEVGTSSDTDFLKEVISDTIELLADDSGDLASFAEAITTIAVDAAGAAVEGDATAVVTEIVESVAEAVTTADDTADVTTIVNNGLSGVSTVDTSSVDVGGAVTAGQEAASNEAPVITSLNLSETAVTVDPDTASSFTAAVTATDTEGDSLSYSWNVSSALTIESGADTATITITVPDFTGDFAITAIVSDGKENTSETVVFSVLPDNSETPAEAAARLVLQGKNALSLGNFTEALNLFGEARSYDSSNDEAALFWSYLNIGSAVVDTAVQEVAAGAGFLGYPGTMEEFVTGDWTTSMPVADSIHTYYDGDNIVQTDVYTSLFPEISIPEGMDSIPYYDIALQDSPQLTWGEYMNALAYNLQSSYPDGFNQPVSDVVELLRSKLDETAAALQSISGSDSISLEPEMFIGGDFDPFTSLWPTDEFGDPETIIVGEAEARLSMATMQIVNSLLNSVLAVDLSIDLAAFYSAFNMSDGLFWDSQYLADQRAHDWNDALESAYNWSALPQYPLSTGFLQTSATAATVLSQSKQYMTDALDNMATAVSGFQAREGVVSSFTFSETEMGADWASFKELVDISGILVDKLSVSLTNGTAVTIPAELFSGTLTGYDQLANWPAAADWTGVSTFEDLQYADIDVNINSLFERPALALDNLIELDGNGEPVIYSEDAGVFTAVANYSAAEAIADKTAGKKFAFKVKDITFGGLLNIPASVVSDLVIDAALPTHINDALTQKTDGSAISYYVSLIEPSAVYSALNPLGSTTVPDDTSDDYVKATGSFWYASVEMLEERTERILDGNDTVDEAEDLTVGGAALDRTLTYSDYDYYSANLTTDSFYRVSITAGQDMDGVNVEIWDELDYYRSFDNFDMTSGNTYSIVFQAQENPLYYIQIEDGYEWYEKDYSISISEVLPADDGNDSIAEALALTIDGAVINDSLVSVDSDYFSVNLTAGVTYKFLLETSNNDNFNLSLVDGFDITYIWGDYVSDGNGRVIYYTCDTTDTYYLKVDDNYLAETLSYAVSASTITLADDGSNDYATAVALVIDDAPVTSDLTFLDRDYFSFVATANTTYTVYIDSTDDFYTSIDVEDSSFNWVYNEYGDFAYGVTLTFECLTEGTHYIYFSGPSGDENQIVNYDISIVQY